MTSIQPELWSIAAHRPSRFTRPPSAPPCCTASATARTSSPSWPSAKPHSGSSRQAQPASACTRRRSAARPAAPSWSSTTQRPSSTTRSPQAPHPSHSRQTNTACPDHRPVRPPMGNRAPPRHLAATLTVTADSNWHVRARAAIHCKRRSSNSVPTEGDGIRPPWPRRSADIACPAAGRPASKVIGLALSEDEISSHAPMSCG
jgi:hypothetical protein